MVGSVGMLNFLRVLRGFAGLCFLLAVGAIILQILVNFVHFDFVMPSSMAIFMLGVMHAVFWLWAFIGLRRIINSIHKKEQGGPHPSLSKPWHL
ncbi:hypothetical protein [Aliidiomarina sedimenti]|nr:hypothetical protein [Aliidiomarina sedimenti]